MSINKGCIISILEKYKKAPLKQIELPINDFNK